MTAAPAQRLSLSGKDRARYFAPVAIVGYICGICIALILTALFLSNQKQSIAVAAAGLFGLFLSSLLLALVWSIQRRELRYWPVPTSESAHINYERVTRLVQSLGWIITASEPDRSLCARTADSLLQQGERVVVQFDGSLVQVASICDPAVGYSLVGRQRCQQHRAQVKRAVLTSVHTPARPETLDAVG